jgi:hypothetical protein
MKTIKILLCVASLAATFSAGAQSRVKGYGLIDLGWTDPGPSNGFLGIVAGGVRYGRWGWGLATGMDQADARSIPLLVDIRWKIVPGAHALEVFSQQGLNYVTKGATVEGYTYKGLAYWRAGLSWTVVDTKGFGGLCISGGWRYRSYKEMQPLYYIDPGFGPEPNPDAVVHKNEWNGFLTIGWRW